MSPKFFDCPICLERYDSGNRVPKLLPRCGHTLCSQCLEQILNRPFPPECTLGCGLLSDQKKPKIKDFPSNLIVIQQLDEEPDQFSFCQLHSKKQMLACIDDGIPICKYCLASGNHENHIILTIKEAKTKAALKNEKLQEILKFYQNGAYQKSCELLEQERFTLQQNIRENFGMLKDLLTKREVDTLNQVDTLFNEQESKTQKLDQEHAKVIQEIQILQIYLSGLVINKSFFEALSHKTIDQFFVNNIKEETSRFAKKMHESNWLSMNKLSDAICLSIQDFQPFGESNNLEVPERMNSIPESQLEKTVNREEEKTDFRQAIRNSHKYEEEEKIDKRFLDSFNDNDEEIEIPSNKHSNKSLLDFDEGQIPEANNEPENQRNSENNPSQNINQPILNKKTEAYGRKLQEQLKMGRISLNFQEIGFNKEIFSCINQAFQGFNDKPLDFKIELSSKELALPSGSISEFCSMNLWKHKNTSHLIFEMKQQGNSKTAIEYKRSSLIKIIGSLGLWNNLRELSLNFSNFPLDKSVVKALVNHVLTHQASLKSLKLDVSNSSISNQDFVSIFADCQKFLANLEAFDFNFNGSKIQPNSLIDFSRRIVPNLKKLHTFRLQINGAPVTDLALKELFMSIRSNLSSIAHFQLDLSATKMSDTSIEIFATTTLPDMKNLETLELHLSGTTLTDQSIQILLQSIPNIANKVRIFRLDLPQTNVTDKSLEALAKYTLAGFKKLEDFELRLARTNITEKGVQVLVSSLQNHPSLMTYLKRFELSLHEIVMEKVKRTVSMKTISASGKKLNLIIKKKL